MNDMDRKMSEEKNRIHDHAAADRADSNAANAHGEVHKKNTAKAHSHTKMEKTEDKTRSELSELQNKCETMQQQLKEAQDKYLRNVADYDNYRKRTRKEMADLFTEAVLTVTKSFLPVIDSVEAALQSCGVALEDPNSGNSSENEEQSIRRGVELIYKQLQDIMQNLGIEEISGSGSKFDPAFHQAVMHEENPAFGADEVSAVLQKGYRIGDRVLRHSMVKVAN